MLVILAVPSLLLLTAAFIVIRRARLRRRKLRAFDPCRRCGFDLRATTGACPECNTPRPKPSRPQTHARLKTADDLFDDFEDEPWHAS
jgi:hypothetical protein